MPFAARFAENPILHPRDVKPSLEGAEVTCLLNPGAFRFDGKTWLLMRVCERFPQRDGFVSTLIADATAPGGVREVAYRLDDPLLDKSDARVYVYDGQPLLSTLSHLRLAWSDDGIHFTALDTPTLTGTGDYETYGIEDCRVSQIGDTYHLTYTAVSQSGVGVGLITTRDWKTFTRYGLVLPPHNKDVALFEERIGGDYAMLHRPVGADCWGPYIWYATSPDLRHWGNHRCVIRTRSGMWDSQRVGAGAAPIRTPHGWLAIYHACDNNKRYCLGALLLDLQEPWKVIARSAEPLVIPSTDYETRGFWGQVVFTNGHVVDGDRIRMYYGAADLVICGADLSISAILATLGY